MLFDSTRQKVRSNSQRIPSAARAYGRGPEIVFSVFLVSTLVAGPWGCNKNPSSESEPSASETEPSASETGPSTTETGSTAAKPVSSDGDSASQSNGSVSHALSEERIAELEPVVRKFCADCHAMPRPTSSSIEEWVMEVDQGFMLYEKSGRTDLQVPSKPDVLAYFQTQADEVLDTMAASAEYDAPKLTMATTPIRSEGNRPPGVSNVRWLDLGIGESNALVYSDIGVGAIKAAWPVKSTSGDGTEWSVKRLVTLLQPVHIEPCDLDADGLTDLVVADIGEFNANDSDLGRVVWVRRKPDSESFETVVLLDELSRVADARAADFDGDGDQDVLVGVFGWRNSGQILLLENLGIGDSKRPEFRTRQIDPRHGAVHVIPQDLNDDGHLDFVALISQEHELIDAFLNDGKGNFTVENIWSAPDPAYGSSGIELVDMDSDGDLDVLYTNGDSFDRGPKPYHSIQWLENRGQYPYTHHPLIKMAGVLNARAADFDADGDMDVVAASLLAEPITNQWKSRKTSSVILLTQVAPGEFEPSTVESQLHRHLSIETGDFDSDGDVDFAIGTFLRSSGADQPDVIIWHCRP